MKGQYKVILQRRGLKNGLVAPPLILQDPNKVDTPYDPDMTLVYKNNKTLKQKLNLIKPSILLNTPLGKFDLFGTGFNKQKSIHICFV